MSDETKMDTPPGDREKGMENRERTEEGKPTGGHEILWAKKCYRRRLGTNLV